VNTSSITKITSWLKFLDKNLHLVGCAIACGKSVVMLWSLKVEIKSIYENADHALALPPFFCQTVNPISTKGAWTPNLMF
jgi:hypothetical protein